VAEALGRLLANLSEHPAPSSLLTQYVPERYGALRRSEVPADPRSIIRSKILEVTETYARACGTRPAA
jgi:D-tagatose-1,6-bisphosphate aldolase subunit GatZ/KbaZ